MRLGIDSSIARLNQAGSGFYARCLVDALLRIYEPSDFTLFDSGYRREMTTKKSIRSRLGTLYVDLLWTHVILPIRASQAGIDLLHMPAGVAPLRSTRRTVVTILDATPLLMPANFPRWQRIYMRALMPRSARRATAILAISENSKRDIVTHMGVDADKVFVTHLAPSPAFRVLEGGGAPPPVLALGIGSYILAVGTLEPRKNMIGLLRALESVRQSGKAYHLIHAGPKGWMYDEILDEVRRLNLDDHVHFLGRVPLGDLVHLYNAALMLVYPSHYEGFGLPVLEAMACGCPVIASHRSSLPEVAGEAAILVDPEDPAAIGRAIINLAEDKALASEMRKKGFLQVSRFSWQQCARETMDAYRHALTVG